MSDSQPTLVGGRYELGELLGRGGMAEVRKGVDTRLGRIVAIKRLRTDLASDATFQARFRREAQSSASLNHPSIVAVYDTGEEPAADGSGVAQPYIVMEFVAGRTLRDVLREGRKILPERALEITSGVLAALDYSHRAGIIHRDIKPGNVMLTPSGDVKVMDFGIARAMSDAANTMTQTAAVVGTAQYLSPEQARGETVDSRSDVYSAGCLLYELLTGRPPFVGDSPVSVAYQHVREQPQPPSDHDTDLPPEIDAIVMKALTKRLEDRYQSAAAMRSDIERYLAGRPVEASVPPVTAATQVQSDPEPTTVRPPADENPQRRNRGVIAAAVLLVLALIVAGVLLWPQLFPGAAEQEQVPDLTGKTEAQARQAIGAAGLTVGTIDLAASDTVRANRVIPGTQEPVAGKYVDPGTTVTFTISTGKPQVTIPADLVGQGRNAVRDRLTGLGLVPELREEEADEPKGQVLSTDPAGGTSVTAGSTVTVLYSDGLEQVPDVVGDKRGQAEQKIKDRGFAPKVFETDDTTQPAGTVIEQDPAAGTEADDGSTVYITVSTFVKPTPTPTPTPTVPTDPPTTDLPTDPSTVVPPPAEQRGVPPVARATPLSGSAQRRRGRAGRRTPER
ncbi:Stk1 family PASTA domain-containing Ser/Thr kinase [Nocardioides pantholopis]|uniref:Stk1 family PASTA domain-containing Ser/Thr kinase n=1 Tax=Nocardioides pantholopis TaxID=2483798 RepID=UPI000FDC1519|nr:Stk1 family PASTA domain-containing Ser/Thr kinase [Nocardioides pantholopis]